jgi:predicted RNase H-like HicB family nuclease
MSDCKMDQAFTVVFEACEEGGYHSFFKELPGIHSQGETLDEAQANLIDALREVIAYRVEQKLKGLNQSEVKHLEAELAS